MMKFQDLPTKYLTDFKILHPLYWNSKSGMLENYIGTLWYRMQYSNDLWFGVRFSMPNIDALGFIMPEIGVARFCM